MARAANLLGVTVGGLLILIGFGVGVVGWLSMGGLFAVLISLLFVMWGGVLVLICVSNLRRARDISRA